MGNRTFVLPIIDNYQLGDIIENNMGSNERIGEKRPSSHAEAGKITYDTIVDLVNRIVVLPEFMAGAARAFFGRSFPNGGRSLIEDGVPFPMDRFFYLVTYRAEPVDLHPRELGDYHTLIRFGLKKFSSDNYVGRRPLADLDIYSSFIENQNREVIKHITGSVSLEDEAGGSGTVIQTFERIPRTFSEIYRTVRL